MKRSLIRVFAIGILFLLLFLPAKREQSLNRAKAASLTAQPTVCLGGWQNPGSAAGEPDGNSAVLSQTAAQIFCGYFQSGDQSNPPAQVTLNFSWNIIFGNQSGQTVQPAATDTDTQNWSAVLSGTSTTSIAPTSTEPATTSTQEEPSSTDAVIVTSTDATSTEQTAADTSTDATAPTSTSMDQTTPPPTPTSTDSNSTTTSFLDNVGKFIAGLFLNKASADTGPAVNFLEVSYSLDGQTWQVLGDVNQNNWQGLTFNIPVTSWDDINKLQIQLSPLPTMDMPEIDLDGMWLQVGYNQSVADALTSGANAALDTAANLSDAVNSALSNVADAITNALTGNNQDQSTSTQPQMPTLPPPPAHRYSFAIGGVTPIPSGPLPWVSEKDADYLKDNLSANTAVPVVTLTDRNTIQIQGGCAAPYYTILIFANPTDYASDPSSAVFNKSYNCTGGNFTKTLSDEDLPPVLQNGTYYLIVADQGDKGPWQPRPGIFQISFAAVAPDASSTATQ